MPLSSPVGRQAIHTRRVICKGYRRDDGLWDIEGHLADTKSYGFENKHRGTVEPGDPVHEMWLRLTIDDEFTVHAVEAVTEKGPFAVCPGATESFQQLVGLTMGPGWNRQVRARLGGAAGCTHLAELTGPMATTAMQTIWPLRQSRQPRKSDRPRLLNSCYAFRSDSPVVKDLWPEHYTGGDATSQ